MSQALLVEESMEGLRWLESTNGNTREVKAGEICRASTAAVLAVDFSVAKPAVVLCRTVSDPSQRLPASSGEMAAGSGHGRCKEDYLMSERFSC